MSKIRVMTTVGTRPDLTRISACINACDKYFDHILVHTGQNWDYSLSGRRYWIKAPWLLAE